MTRLLELDVAPPAHGARPPIPETLEEALSPAWLTAALATRHPGVRVADVTPGPVISRVATNARFRIHCSGPVPEGLPEHLCVKGYFTEAGRPSRGAGLPEAQFYRSLAGPTGVRTLPYVYADADEATLASVLVTEDVAASGGVFLDPLSSYAAEQVSRSLEELARLHAATWLQPAIARQRWLAPWLPTLLRGRGVAEIRGNFEGPIGAGVPERIRDAQRLFDAYEIVATEAMKSAPWSVIHGDAHVGNLFLDSGGRPAFVDWQLVQRGPWYIDVGYHIASTLPPEERRRCERDLVRHYLEHLARAGVQAPDEAEAWYGVRRGFIHGFYLWGITLKVAPPITAELLRRIGTAVDDHEALSEFDGR